MRQEELIDRMCLLVIIKDSVHQEDITGLNLYLIIYTQLMESRTWQKFREGDNFHKLGE